jgi:hypothetical protein
MHGLVTIARGEWFSTCSGPHTARCHRLRYRTTGNSRQRVVYRGLRNAWRMAQAGRFPPTLPTRTVRAP